MSDAPTIPDVAGARFRWWITDENLQAVCEILAGYAGYDFCEADWDAIRFGVRDTHTEQGRWYEYEFLGNEKIALRLGYDEPGTGVIFVEWSAPASLCPKIEVVLDLAAERTISCLNNWQTYGAG